MGGAVTLSTVELVKEVCDYIVCISYISSNIVFSVSSAPQNLKVVNQTSSTLTLSWSPPEFINGDVQSYLLHFENSTSSITIPPNVTSYIVRSLKCSSSYTVYMTLKTKFFESLSSNVVRGATSVTGMLVFFSVTNIHICALESVNVC